MMWRFAMLWVVLGAVVFGGVAKAEDKPDPVQAYKEFLKGLPKDTPESITKAINQYCAVIVPRNEDKRIRAFRDFLDFHGEVCIKLTQIFWDRLSLLAKEKKVEDIHEELEHSEEARNLHNYGLELSSDWEGGFYVRGIPEYIPGVFSPHLPKSVRRYLQLREAEIREGYSEDGAWRTGTNM